MLYNIRIYRGSTKIYPQFFRLYSRNPSADTGDESFLLEQVQPSCPC